MEAILSSSTRNCYGLKLQVKKKYYCMSFIIISAYCGSLLALQDVHVMYGLAVMKLQLSPCMWQTVRRQHINSKVSPQGVEMICHPPRQFSGGISFCCQSGHLSMVQIAVDVQGGSK